MTVTEYNYPIQWAQKIDKFGILKPLFKKIQNTISQELVKYYCDAGMLAVYKPDSLKNIKNIKYLPFVINKYKSVDIDNMDDFNFAVKLKNMDKERIIVGTANFGMRYGLNKNKLKYKEVCQLSKILNKNKIHAYDTAQTYGKSEKIIGKLKVKKKVYTKIIIKKSNDQRIEKIIDKLINVSLKNLNTNRIEGIYIHNVQYFLENKEIQLKIIKKLNEYKKKKIIKKIGFSLYTLDELNAILKILKPDMIQIPVNILDQRFLKKNVIKKIKKDKIEIQAISIFLRGNLVNNNKFQSNKVHKKVREFEKWCKFKDVDKVSACINFVRKHKFINNIILGIDNKIQLEKILNIFNSTLFIVPNKFQIDNFKLIDLRKI